MAEVPEDNPFAAKPAPAVKAPRRSSRGAAAGSYQPPSVEFASGSAAEPAPLVRGAEPAAAAGAGAGAAAAAAPAPGGRGACYGVKRTYSTCSGAIGAGARNRCATLSCQSFSAVTALTVFAFSCALLDARPFAGQGCSPTAQGQGCAGQLNPTCATLTGGGGKCSDLCALPAYDAVAPFRFAIATPGFDSSPIWCGFPKINVSWRIPLSLFSGFAAAAAAVFTRLRRPNAMALLGVTMFVGGCLFLYVMGIDGVAADNGLKLCKQNFAGTRVMIGENSLSSVGLKVTCASEIFASVVVLDFFLFPLLAASGVMTVLHRKYMTDAALTAAPAAAAAATAAAGAPIDPTRIVWGSSSQGVGV